MSSLCLGPFLMPSGTGGSVGGDESTAGAGPGWFQKAKVRPPERPKGYVSRPSLAQHLEGVLQRRLTVLQAPAGFGKTTLLADVARRTREEGVVVGWISLDSDDTPNVFRKPSGVRVRAGGAGSRCSRHTRHLVVVAGRAAGGNGGPRRRIARRVVPARAR